VEHTLEQTEQSYDVHKMKMQLLTTIPSDKVTYKLGICKSTFILIFQPFAEVSWPNFPPLPIFAPK
jgi:hypothetical protein